MPQETIRLPKSSGRTSQIVFCKLLYRVDPEAENGFGFEGTPLKPGAFVAWDELWPTPKHPPVPILLECAGATNPVKGPGRRNQQDLYILWKFDLQKMVWIEIARSASTSWAWALDLRPVAVRALEESRNLKPRRESSFETVVTRIDRYLDWQLQRLPVEERRRAIAAIHDQLYTKLLAQPKSLAAGAG